MKNKTAMISLMLVLSVWFGVAFKCGGTDGPGGIDPKLGFTDGHKLAGRYKKSDVFQYFTFSDNGTFEQSAAISETIRGGSVVGSTSTSGTYYVSGNTLSLTYADGVKKQMRIEVFNCCAAPDYNQQSPAQLKLNGGIYVNVD